MIRALAAATAVALAVALWLYLPPGEGGAANTEGATTQHAPLPGFRADAWYLPDDELLGFVEIPGGPFLMGSAAGDTMAFANERWTQRESPQAVEVPTFFIGRFEVTVAQLQAFVEATGHRADPQALAGSPTDPATFVSWTDALAYSRWLDGALRNGSSTPAKLLEVLNAGGRVTLPSEAEWEKAARGTDGRVYPWGNELVPGRANFQGRGLAPVGSFPCPECSFGLSDMSGNAWEWTRSPFRDRAYGGAEPPPDLQADALWVMRGGSFGDPARYVRAALRGGADPSVRRPFIGFRVAISSE